MGVCSHGIEERVECPVMLLGIEAVQLTKPKLGRLSDAANFHDPWVTSLGSPVRVSKLRDCHFKELSDRGLLSAPCPLEAPPCGNTWRQRWIEASVTASQWSQRVQIRIYHCTCLDEAHTIHLDGEHLGLYTWNRRTLFVQESLQLILRGMQKGHSFKAELATNQAAFERSLGAEVLNEETWRRASLDFFKLVGLGIRDCCTLCGPHPEVSNRSWSLNGIQIMANILGEQCSLFWYDCPLAINMLKACTLKMAIDMIDIPCTRSDGTLFKEKRVYLLIIYNKFLWPIERFEGMHLLVGD
jgi:hypothetical protein